ncbi:hypothetical protein MAC_03308 [Metarhizium acridum CQMa 102]|uniref:Uncharacterized protein n=1 Tax=Metarhizium acridum (strain CQMa 102) TaxID=655827 RepID=E9E032_METAQ|nr:uncharacterized protein MAC_03308 [Metarhizium acridum CQMa 102]EFY90728.1 hypothetical protein MAC_03308 [Metarhizium acridum CQMa 102]
MPSRVQDIRSDKSMTIIPADVSETMTHRLLSLQDSTESSAGLPSGIQSLDLDNEKPDGHTSNDPGDLIPMPFWDISQDVPASSVLESWTEEDRLKFGIHEGMDVNHGLPPFDENVREYHTAKTASSKRKSDDGIHDSTEIYGGINVTFGLPPWIETKFSETGETSEKNSNQYHFGAPFIQVSSLSPTPPRKDTDCKALRSVSLSAVGTPTVAESRTLPLAETKDTAATGNTDIEPPLLSQDS